jgi:hypothetical protein
MKPGNETGTRLVFGRLRDVGNETGTRLVFGRLRDVGNSILRRKPPSGSLKESRASFYDGVPVSLELGDSGLALNRSEDPK